MCSRAVPEQTYGSHLSISGWAGASRSYVPYIQLKTAIDIDYQRGSGATKFKFDMLIHGPLLGAVFHF